MRRPLLLALGLLCLALGLWFSGLFRTQPLPKNPATASPPQTLTEAARTKAQEIASTRAQAQRPALTAAAPIQPGEFYPPTRDLNSPQNPPAQDLRIILETLKLYQESFGGFPAGEDNRQFVNALSGNNPKGLAFLDRKNAAISPAGELLDRWKSPYFFHLIQSDYIEIHSAGPDRSLWTKDDLVLANRPPAP